MWLWESKVCGPRKSVRWRKKTYEPQIYVNYKKKTLTFPHFHFPEPTFFTTKHTNVWLQEMLEMGLKINKNIRVIWSFTYISGPTSFLSPTHIFIGAHKLYFLIITSTFHLLHFSISNSFLSLLQPNIRKKVKFKEKATTGVQSLSKVP